MTSNFYGLIDEHHNGLCRRPRRKILVDSSVGPLLYIFLNDLSFQEAHAQAKDVYCVYELRKRGVVHVSSNVSIVVYKYQGLLHDITLYRLS